VKELQPQPPTDSEFPSESSVGNIPISPPRQALCRDHQTFITLSQSKKEDIPTSQNTQLFRRHGHVESNWNNSFIGMGQMSDDSGMLRTACFLLFVFLHLFVAIIIWAVCMYNNYIWQYDRVGIQIGTSARHNSYLHIRQCWQQIVVTGSNFTDKTT
jgi:hypothetical protein